MEGGASKTTNAFPSVSVVVPVFNAGATLSETLPAVLAQEDTKEIIFVDDGSTDGTGDVLRRLTVAHDASRVLTHAENRGRAAARNTGLAEVSGEVVLFLDADMRPAPGFVRAHAEVYRDSHVIGAVSNPVLEGLGPDDPYHRYLRSRRGAAGVGPSRETPFRFFIIGYTSVKTEAARAVGGFDERFSYGEDIDFAYRLNHEMPGRLVFAERAVVHHYNHGDLDTRLAKLRLFGRDNLPLLLAKHPGIGKMANLRFVDSEAGGWSAALGRMLLRSEIAASVRALLPYLPAPLGLLAVRYLSAEAVAAGYRATPQH